LVGVSDVLINILIYIFSGSVVMLSQALQGGADLFTSGFLVLGIKRSKKPSDRRHPFGYGRELYFWTFLSSLTIFTVTSGTAFHSGYKRFLMPEPIEHLLLVILALAIGIVTNGYSMSLSFKRLLGGKPLTSIVKIFLNSALIETKTTFILDLMGTIAPILGLISVSLYIITGYRGFDGIGAMAVGMTLAVLAFFIVKGAKDLLVGQAASAEVEEKIWRVTKKDPNVRDILDLRTLHIGNERLLINMELHLSDELTTDEIEVLVDKIEKEIKDEIPSATNIQIELETPDVI
jgi:cation diffusion facilitator family transporter